MEITAKRMMKNKGWALKISPEVENAPEKINTQLVHDEKKDGGDAIGNSG